jgi:hypothetical protein
MSLEGGIEKRSMHVYHVALAVEERRKPKEEPLSVRLQNRRCDITKIHTR